MRVGDYGDNEDGGQSRTATASHLIFTSGGPQGGGGGRGVGGSGDFSPGTSS